MHMAFAGEATVGLSQRTVNSSPSGAGGSIPSSSTTGRLCQSDRRSADSESRSNTVGVLPFRLLLPYRCFRPWSRGLAVRTPPFHGGDRGFDPRRDCRTSPHKVPSSSGQDSSLSRRRRGFDSRRDYQATLARRRSSVRKSIRLKSEGRWFDPSRRHEVVPRKVARHGVAARFENGSGAKALGFESSSFRCGRR